MDVNYRESGESIQQRIVRVYRTRYQTGFYRKAVNQDERLEDVSVSILIDPLLEPQVCVNVNQI